MGPSDFLLAAATCAVMACSMDPAAELEAGFRALDGGLPALAREHFEQVLARLPGNDHRHLQARLGTLAADCSEKFGEPQDEFLLLAKAEPERIGVREFLEMTGWLVSSRRYKEALAVLDAGLVGKYPDSSLLASQRVSVQSEWLRNRPVVGTLRSLCSYGQRD